MMGVPGATSDDGRFPGASEQGRVKATTLSPRTCSQVHGDKWFNDSWLLVDTMILTVFLNISIMKDGRF